MIETLRNPWHWPVAGILIGLTVPVLLIMGNKKFGVSSCLRDICAACIPANIPFFKYDWKKNTWNLFFVLGIVIGGYIAANYLSNPNQIEVAQATKQTLAVYGINNFSQILPIQLFNSDIFFTLKGLIFFVLGGFLVGFGTRYAGGCTSGHSIMGLANLQLPSFVATIFFMVGGFISANYLIPIIFKYL